MAAKGEYPIPKFHFQVEWGGAKIGFTEVTGLAPSNRAENTDAPRTMSNCDAVDLLDLCLLGRGAM